MAALILRPSTAAQALVQIDVNASRVIHTMAGGAGASWHAMGPAAYWYKDLNRNNRNSRGSGWGGNPPLEYSAAWDDLRRHARWLGLDFIRVEVSMRMYEPERGRFDWDNDEMRTLYKILDICNELHTDVFLTEMWQDVDWNAFPAAGRLQSAPRSVPDFAVGVGALLEHLVKDRGYNSIRWFCITNEPGMDWGWWNGPDAEAALDVVENVCAAPPQSFRLYTRSAPNWTGVAYRALLYRDPIGASTTSTPNLISMINR
jgi:hypothetical protein